MMGLPIALRDRMRWFGIGLGLVDAPVRASSGRSLAAGQDQEAPRRGHISLVGAGPGAADLLTLRAVDHIRRADVVLYDRLISDEILDLIPSGIETVYVGKAVGACAWPQDKIDALIVEEALKGRRVVRLKSGDPSIFGRACEEIAAARAADIPVEIIPGITAASAAAASLTRPLTSRGLTDTFVLTTGTCRPGDAPSDRTRFARPGTSMAFYMAVERAGEIQRDLLEAGVPPECEIDVVASVSTPHERKGQMTLGTLTQEIEAQDLHSPAVIFIRYPKTMAACEIPAQAGLQAVE
ncbi:uroporphyrinogen-III C-methyltransferase [Thioclava sp. GXIMD2076]|uniref:uroporphyrinogen-III C-methyltransferase n=1 Tax=Thioclava sp. GXIMD2076 TaxID=3131931 RepID=UPI0030CD180C